jgi:flagellar protein FliS
MDKSMAHIGAYRKVDVETASQGKLVVMLLNGAIQRTEEAKRLLDSGSVQGIHDNLIRAQEIITELRSALNMDVGEVATNVDRIYEYLIHLMVQANINKDPKAMDECIEHLLDVREMWREAFEKAATESASVAPKINPHGESIMNLQG